MIRIPGNCLVLYVGPEAGEQIHMLEAACQSTRGLWFFKDMSYSHPSWCEELETAIDLILRPTQKQIK